MNKSESISIQQQIKESYFSFFKSGDQLVIGVSGGADSMALLYLLHKSAIPVFVVHINYGLRGDESDADQQLVEEVCSMWGIECCSVRLKKEQESGNFQNWARIQRYQIFRDLKNEHDAAGIAIAHHKDDHLETILFKMLRGGGISSWKGMEVWDGELFRPLLGLTKSEITSFCEIEAIPYREDSSNRTNTYARNAFRNQVFPYFDEFIPGWQSNLELLSAKSTLSNEALSVIYDSLIDNYALRIDGLKEFSDDLQSEMLRRFVLNTSDISPSKGQIQQLHDLLDAQVGKLVILDEQYSVVKNRDALELKVYTKNSEIDQILQIEALQSGVNISGWVLEKNSHVDPTSIRMDSSKIDWPLRVRHWKNGDAFTPLGMKGSQKISDHLTHRKISASKKQESLILIDSGGTICAILYPEKASNGEFGCISEKVKITDQTVSILSISKS